jgi:hypothetical protein
MKGQNWTPIYMAIILAIAAVILFAVIKPMFQSASDYASTLGALLF